MNRKFLYWVMSILGIVALVIIISFTITGNADSKGGHDSSYTTNDGQNPDAQTDLQKYLLEQEDIMSEMMKDMNIQPTGYASADFLLGMIPHHEAAIEMAEEYLEYGGDTPHFKNVALNIIKTQENEIDQMEDMIDRITDTQAKDKAAEKAYLTDYTEIMNKHDHVDHKSFSVTDIDKAFAEGMKLHHEMAVEMSEKILYYTEDTEVRNLAENIIKAQKKEIKEFQDFLK